MTEPLPPTAVPSKADGVLATDSHDLTVLMSMETGRFVELNATAREAWKLADGTVSIARIGEILAERFAVSPEQCASDVAELYAGLRDEGLVVIAD